MYPKNSSPLHPGTSQSSKSCFDPRMHRVPLQPDEPPRNLPLLSFTWRLLMPEPSVEMTFQSVSLSKFWDQLMRLSASNTDGAALEGTPTRRPCAQSPKSRCAVQLRGRGRRHSHPRRVYQLQHTLLSRLWRNNCQLLSPGVLERPPKILISATNPQTMKS